MEMLRQTIPGDAALGDEWDRVDIRCYPSSDTRFVLDVQAVIAEWAYQHEAIEPLTARLARTYPNIKVVKQDSLATLGKRPVLYAYRDGAP
jgi:hypothetical protein